MSGLSPLCAPKQTSAHRSEFFGFKPWSSGTRHGVGSGPGWCTTPRIVSNLAIRNRNLMELKVDPSILSLDFNSRAAGASGQSRRNILIQESRRRCR
jgi:hypothetical protein